MFRDRFILLLCAAAAVQLAVLWLVDVPLGVPGEWTWDRIPYGPAEARVLLLGLVTALPAALLFLGVVVWGDRQIVSAGRGATAAWLLALAGAGFAWLWSVQEAGTQDVYRLGRGLLVLEDRGSSGYFTIARQPGSDAVSLLASWEARVAQGDVLHIGTHPPGLVLLHRGLITSFTSMPTLGQWVLATRPASAVQIAGLLDELTAQEGRSLSVAEQAALWAAVLLTQAATAAAVVPLFLFCQRRLGTSAAWRAACLWPLVPALAIFLPKSDALFPLLGMSMLALWDRRGRRFWSDAAAGGLLWLGLMLSLALLPYLVAAGLLTLADLVQAPRSGRRGLLRERVFAAAVMAGVFGTLTVGIWLVWHLNLPAVWAHNLRNHAGFYAVTPRSYGGWLVETPVEISVAVGLPVALAAVWTLLAAWHRRDLAGAWPGVVFATVLGLLWLSGKTSGEAARLWILFLPWILTAAAPMWDSADDPRSRWRWRTALGLQMLVCVATAVRVTGFGFARLGGLIE